MPSPPPLAPDPSADALREAQRRAARGGMKRTVLLLHLSGLSGTEVYHARVARAVMADAARLLEGEVLRLSDGDLALVCAFVPGFTRGPDDDGPDGLPSVLRRLFARVTPPDGDLFRCWHLPAEGASLLAFLDARPAAPARPDAAPAGRDPLAVAGTLLDHADINGLLQRQVALRLIRQGEAVTFRPVALSVGLHDAAVQERMTAFGVTQPDAMVLRHLSARLDRRWLSRAAPNEAGFLPPSGAALHLRLALQTAATLSAEAMASWRAQARSVSVELALAELLAAPMLAQAALARLRAGGLDLVLGGIPVESLALANPAALPVAQQAAAIRVTWSATLPRQAGPARARTDLALHALTPSRLILTRAETEAALAWGLKRGITVFEGRQTAALMAAARLKTCPHASRCSLAQCQFRAATLDPAARAECHNPPLRDAALPAPAQAWI